MRGATAGEAVGPEHCTGGVVLAGLVKADVDERGAGGPCVADFAGADIAAGSVDDAETVLAAWVGLAKVDQGAASVA